MDSEIKNMTENDEVHERTAEHEINSIKLSHRERVLVEEHERLSPHLMFEIIRQSGIDELLRPTQSLLYSGIAAGIVITFSFFCTALLTMYLPNEPWTPIISKWGYTVGFILVILGHMQLFTENTITTVVPVCKPFRPEKVKLLLRLWGIVLGANLIGTTLAASFLTTPGLLDEQLAAELLTLAEHVAHFSAFENLIRGIPAGILIAALVWMLPTARQFSFFLIAFFTYFIALGDFTHIVVGSAEMFYAVLHGVADMSDYFFRFLIPTGIGNILGGTGVFTLLIYGQVEDELKEK